VIFYKNVSFCKIALKITLEARRSILEFERCYRTRYKARKPQNRIVRLAVRTLHVDLGHPAINLHHLQSRMAQQRLQSEDIATRAQECDRHCMPESVWMSILHAGFLRQVRRADRQRGIAVRYMLLCQRRQQRHHGRSDRQKARCGDPLTRRCGREHLEGASQARFQSSWAAWCPVFLRASRLG
jgi:hypothetical protein